MNIPIPAAIVIVISIIALVVFFLTLIRAAKDDRDMDCRDDG
jgi:hypothetical protein